MKKIIIPSLFFSFFMCTFFITNASATSVLLYDLFGGTYYDAEKSSTNSEDDLMCWAASASNLLAWTGWGFPDSESFTDEDDIFQYFQDHWTDQGGNVYYGIDWWFDGTNNSPTDPAVWSQVNVAGGGFWTGETFSDYYLISYNPTYWSYAMSNLEYLITNGYATSLSIKTDSGNAHAITVWGFEYDTFGYYSGIWVTDSDDHKNQTNPSNNLVYYDVTYNSTSKAWYLQDFSDTDNWYITQVFGLERNPVPEPATIILFGIGLLGVAGIAKKKYV
ncbi:IdeS/Mac family cysteine endopeptidase [Desulfobacter sp.]|uniref:IdeS/Mac family cysteine endopeptidase n=1 Tax=Desulfobacter sp. TaxID=2294 RepID=UPI002579CAF1|nr:IdeS/Mac family cysteine endopeptidase [Desulfobacter sp.]